MYKTLKKYQKFTKHLISAAKKHKNRATCTTFVNNLFRILNRCLFLRTVQPHSVSLMLNRI